MAKPKQASAQTQEKKLRKQLQRAETAHIKAQQQLEKAQAALVKATSRVERRAARLAEARAALEAYVTPGIQPASSELIVPGEPETIDPAAGQQAVIPADQLGAGRPASGELAHDADQPTGAGEDGMEERPGRAGRVRRRASSAASAPAREPGGDGPTTDEETPTLGIIIP